MTNKNEVMTTKRENGFYWVGQRRDDGSWLLQVAESHYGQWYVVGSDDYYYESDELFAFVGERLQPPMPPQ